MTGFPSALLKDLGCLRDGAPLELARVTRGHEGAIIDGLLTCPVCRECSPIVGGIVDLIDRRASPHAESAREQLIRDRHAATIDPTKAWWRDPDNVAEMQPTLAALRLSHEVRLLELGCGDGRYTVQLAGRCASVLAVDFSLESLRVLQQRMPTATNVGLVLADVTMIRLGANIADRVFSTLVSNLPTPEHRLRLHDLARHALTPDGCFVFSVHHHGLRQRVSGEPQAGHYRAGHIFRYAFRAAECRGEVAPYFETVRTRLIQVDVPFGSKLGAWAPRLSAIGERVWPLSELGRLVLCVAENPRPAASEPSA